MDDYEDIESSVGMDIITRGKSPSTWLGYKTVSRRYREFIKARLTSFPAKMEDDWRQILERWDIAIPPHLPPTTLLCDHELALFAIHSRDILGY